ncbi:hypothetical protein I79_007144 [Cricetulus griseus]|uniref:Uncharacterized protein n=1 Tax=Cricetulus griseus TaxID=10029 RepID=G3H9R4_CRIGR|nr:hypothetical protein I79_007144 [Cricetulus griseus]
MAGKPRQDSQGEVPLRGCGATWGPLLGDSRQPSFAALGVCSLKLPTPALLGAARHT